ncbi:MAG: SdiA-regulated domain-containing protein [Deltaproteobacteria bacterium]|nr:SdiA-regulated domain-containing protein [Deltaproteobacteria bacterium]
MPNPVRPTGRTPASAPRDVVPARFRPAAFTKVEVKEASDVCALPGGAFLVVGDRSDSAALLRPDGSQVRVKLAGLKDHKSGLEGVAFDPLKKRLFVSSEEKGELLRYAFDAATGRATLEKRFHLDLGGKANKGVEGLAWLPGHASPTGTPQLLLAKEGKPRTLALLDDSGKGKPLELQLDSALKEACRDFSAVTVDSRSGHLFVASDASSLVAEVALERSGGSVRARLVQSLPLRDDRGQPLRRVEGLAFDPAGNLHVLQENDRRLWRLERL